MPPARSASGTVARWRGPLRSWPPSFRRSRSCGVLSAWLAGTWPFFLRLAIGPLDRCRMSCASTIASAGLPAFSLRAVAATGQHTVPGVRCAVSLASAHDRLAVAPDGTLVVEPVTHLGLADDHRFCTDR